MIYWITCVFYPSIYYCYLFWVYINFTLWINSRQLYLLSQRRKQGIISVSTNCSGGYDLTTVWLGLRQLRCFKNLAFIRDLAFIGCFMVYQNIIIHGFKLPLNWMKHQFYFKFNSNTTQKHNVSLTTTGWWKYSSKATSCKLVRLTPWNDLWCLRQTCRCSQLNKKPRYY